MQINVGGIAAKCFCCGSNDFAPLRPRPDERTDKLACAECGTEVFFDDLLSQIGRAAIARREAARFYARLAEGGLDQ